MREALKKAIEEAIIIKYSLPHVESGWSIDKSVLTAKTKEDYCFSKTEEGEISRIIYNGIVEFAINEYQINYSELDKEQSKTISRYLHYDRAAKHATKLKYGFYGEVLLDEILRVYLNTSVLAARGYFYSSIENSEPKGFDAFHIVERSDNSIDLWFGEAKFYQNYIKAIGPVLNKLSTSLSDAYLNRNCKVILNERLNISSKSEKLKELLDFLEDNPEINIAEEISKRGIRLIYPVFIAYQKAGTEKYHESIQKCIDYIKVESKRIGIKVSTSFEYQIFFIFLPLSEVKKIKEEVIEWIETKEPLI